MNCGTDRRSQWIGCHPRVKGGEKGRFGNPGELSRALKSRSGESDVLAVPGKGSHGNGNYMKLP